MAFLLGLIAQEQGPTAGLAGHARETFAQRVVAVLGARDFEIAIPGEFFVHEDLGFPEGVVARIEAGGEEAGFEVRGVEDGLLGEGPTARWRVPRRPARSTGLLVGEWPNPQPRRSRG